MPADRQGNPAGRLAYPDLDEGVSREVLAQLDEAAPCSEHWKILYPAEIFPVRVRTTSHGIAAASGKLGAFIGTYALTALLPAIGLSKTSGIVAGVAVLGLLATVTLLPEPKGISLEELTEPSPGR